MSVEVVLPGSLADLTGGEKHLHVVDVPGGTLGALLDLLAARHPLLGRRIRDETGSLRRYVNIYVDGEDVRYEGTLAAAVRDGAVVQILPSVAGG